MFKVNVCVCYCSNKHDLFQSKILKEILQKDLGQTVIDQVDPEANISCSDILFTGKLFKFSGTLTDSAINAL